MNVDRYTNLKSKNATKFKIILDIFFYDSLFCILLFLYIFWKINATNKFFKESFFDEFMNFSILYKTSNWEKPLIISLLISLVVGFIIYKFLAGNSKKQHTDNNHDIYLRGAKLSRDVDSHNNQIIKSKEAVFFELLLKQNQAKLDKFLVPLNDSIYQSYLLFGKPGAGKTTMIRQMIQYATRNFENQKTNFRDYLYSRINYKFLNPNMLCVDVKGDDYVPIFYRPDRDFIFNPADSRSLVWNVFDEIKTLMDISTICEILVPDSNKGEPFWAISSQAVLFAILFYLKFTKKENAVNEDILELSSRTASELVKIFSSNEHIKKQTMLAIAALQSGEKTAPNVLAFLNAHLSAFKNLKSKAEDPKKQFTIAKFLSSKGMHIYLNNRSDAAGFVKPILSLFTTLLIMRILSSDDDKLNPTLLILDEFTSLQKIKLIDELVLKGRSKKVISVFGIQTLDNIKETYGNDALANSLVSAVSNQLFLANSGETSEKISSWIGEQEVDREQSTRNISQKETTTMFTLTPTVKKAVLPSQISNLKKLQGYLKFDTEEYFLLNFDIAYFNKRKVETFILNPDFSIEQMIEAAKIIEKLENTKKDDVEIPAEIIENVKNIDIDKLKIQNLNNDNEAKTEQEREQEHILNEIIKSRQAEESNLNTEANNNNETIESNEAISNEESDNTNKQGDESCKKFF